MKRWITFLLVVVMVFSLGGSCFAIGRSTDNIERGVLKDGVYENAFLGIACELDEDWHFMTDDEIAEANGVARDMLDDENLQELLEKTPVLTEMYATYDDGVLLTGINIENIGLVYGLVMDEDSYIDMSMDTIEQSIAAVGLEDYTLEKVTVDFAGAERPAVKLSGTVGDESAMYQLQVCIKVDNYMCLVLLQSMDEDRTEELAGLYYALEEDADAEDNKGSLAKKGGDAKSEGDEEAEAEPVEEPVHFIEGMGNDGAYAYVDLIGISDWVYRDGIKRYYAAEDEDYYYIVSVRGSQLADMEDIAEYWDREEDSEDPPVYTLTGYMGTISEDVREAFKYVFDIDDETFDRLFGDDYLDATPIH